MEPISHTPVEGEPTSDRDARIRERAHQLWEAEGRQEGRADEYWHRAAELIESEGQAAYPPAQSGAHRT
jgi:hypothetical protein